MEWIYNHEAEERKKREALQQAHDLSEAESQAGVDDFIKRETAHESLSARFREMCKEAMDKPFSEKVLLELSRGLECLYRELDEMDRRSPFPEYSPDQVYGVVFSNGCYFFYSSNPMRLPSIPHLFFCVEKAKLRPEQIEFLEGKISEQNQ